MASFFDDVFGAVTGEQSVPQQTIIPTGDLLAQAYGAAAGAAPGVIAYNQALAPGLTNVQLGVANQIDPSILANFRGANQSILDQLNLGSSLGQELQEDVIRNALEGTAASGFGVGVGGRGLVARDLGITGLDLQRRRQQDALQAGTSGLGVSSSFYRPDTGIGPAAIASDIQQVQAAKDELANLTEDIRRQNFSSLLNTGGRIAGTVIGGIYGGGAGAQIGGQIGGSMITGSRVAGQKKESAGGGGGGMTSMLSGLFGGGMNGGAGGGGMGGNSTGDFPSGFGGQYAGVA